MSRYYVNCQWNYDGLREEGYMTGSIIRVKMVNFLTYDFAEVFPGPRLNVILGPNGTGKSTITHAICLACDGSPATLGRPPELNKFVKHGKDGQNSFVEVDIYLGQSTICIRRSINSETKGSKWRMNDIPCSHSKIKEALSELSIDMDNLCTFMPQDKVGSFSAYKAKDILEKTLQAIKIPEKTETYFDLQKVLGDVENQKLEFQKELNFKQQKYDNAMAEIASLKTEIERAEQRDFIKKKLDYYTTKAAVITCQEIINQHEQKIAEVHQAEAKLVAAKKEVAPLENIERAAKRQLAEVESVVDTFFKKAKTAEQRSVAYKNQATEENDISGDFLAKIEAVDKERKIDVARAEVSTNKILQLESDLVKARVALPAAEKSLDSIKKDIQQTNEASISYSNELSDLKAHLAQENSEIRRLINLQEKLQDSKQIFRTRLLHLANSSGSNSNRRGGSGGNQIFNDSIRAMDCIEKCHDSFKEEVFGPVAMYVQVDDHDFASMVEKTITQSKLLCFVATCYEDSDILKREFGRLGIRNDVITIENMTLKRNSPIPRIEWLQLGYLSTHVKCNDVIRVFLHTFGNLHDVMYCRVGSTQHIQNEGTRLLDGRPRVRVFAITDDTGRTSNMQQQRQIATNNSIFDCNIVKSRYADSVTSQISTVSVKGLIGKSTEDADVRAREIQHEIDHYKGAIEMIEVEMTSLKQSLTQSQDNLKRLQIEKQEETKKTILPNELERKIKSESTKLQEIQTKLSADTHERVSKYQRELSDSFSSVLSCIDKYFQNYNNFLDSELELGVSKAYKLQAIRSADEASEKIVEARESLRFFEIAIRDAKKARDLMDKKKIQKEDELNLLLEKYGGEVEFSEKVWPDIITECPEESIEELEEKCISLQAEYDSTHENKGAVDRHHQLVQETAQMKSDLDILNAQCSDSQAELAKRSEKWCTDVREIAAQINESFEQYMEELQYKGDVSMLEVGSILDYEMQLRVSFRDSTELAALSAHKHSGGERAVSTIMYLMAMQNLTTVPFRIVDEINQGMDERNERLVFDRIVRNCCCDSQMVSSEVHGPSTNRKIKLKPQYFLVSPKLLPGLRAMEHDDVTVLLVLNGPDVQCDWLKLLGLPSVGRPISSNLHADSDCKAVVGRRTLSLPPTQSCTKKARLTATSDDGAGKENVSAQDGDKKKSIERRVHMSTVIEITSSSEDDLVELVNVAKRDSLSCPSSARRNDNNTVVVIDDDDSDSSDSYR